MSDRCPTCGQVIKGEPWMPPFVVGSETSYAAAVSMLEQSESLRTRCFQWIRKRGAKGATIEEVHLRYSVKWQTISARIYELHRMGLIVAQGKRTNTSGREADVWVALEFLPPHVNAVEMQEQADRIREQARQMALRLPKDKE